MRRFFCAWATEFDRLFAHFGNFFESGNDFRTQDDVAKPARPRTSGRNFQPEIFSVAAAQWRLANNQAAQAVPPTSVHLEGNSAPRSRGWIPVLLQTRPLGKMRRGDRRHDQYHAVGTFSF